MVKYCSLISDRLVEIVSKREGKQRVDIRNVVVFKEAEAEQLVRSDALNSVRQVS